MEVFKSVAPRNASPKDELNKNNFLKDIKVLLKNRVFSGCYTERRLIEAQQLLIYKDVVVVNKSEQEFKKILETANESLNTHFHGQIITCISNSKRKDNLSDYSIWTNLSSVSFGYHWFMITNVTFSGSIVNITIRALRRYESERKSVPALTVNSFEWENFTICIINTLKKFAKVSSEILTIENLTYLYRFLLILFLTLLIGTYRVFELLVKYIHELNFFIRTLTPVFIVFIDSITKAFGGLLIVIAMMWNGEKRKNRNANISSHLLCTKSKIGYRT